MRNQLLLQLGMAFVCLVAAPHVLPDLLPPPGTEDDLPFSNVPALIVKLVLGFTPFFAVIVGVLFLVVFFFGEAGGSHEPITTRAARDPHALRDVLRRVREWLAQQQMPAVTAPLATSIGTLCLELDRQLEGRDHAQVATATTKLHKLLTVELATLVLRYQRVPRAQRLLPYLNASANDLLVNGLRAVDDQLRAVHEHLTQNDLHDLHVQTRYLELKSESESRTSSFAPTAAPTLNTGSGPARSATVAPKATPAPLSTSVSTESMHWHEREASGLTLLETVGVAAVTTAVMDTLLADDEQPAAKEPFAGGGGAFGGAGASGDWSTDTDDVDLDVANSSDDDNAELDESA